MQETWVPSLIRKDPTCLGAAKLVSHHYGSLQALEQVLHNRKATVVRSRQVTAREQPPLTATREKPVQG